MRPFSHMPKPKKGKKAVEAPVVEAAAVGSPEWHKVSDGIVSEIAMACLCGAAGR